MTTSSPVKRSNLLIGAAIVVLLGAGWYFTHRSGPKAPAAPPSVSVTTALVKSQGVPLYVVFRAGEAGAGHALPTVLTQSIAEEALTPATH